MPETLPETDRDAEKRPPRSRRGSRRPANRPTPRALAKAPGPDLLADRYRLIERIGTGGSSEVWRAQDERLGRDVAVKLLHAHLLPDSLSRARFVAEARAAGALAHPSIVPVYDVIEDDERAAIVFQLIPGETLAARIERTGALDPSAATAIARQLASGLAHAHGHGLVHRDVKPANVLLSEDHRAMLVDFGIAQMLEDARSTMTATGEVMGTLRYLSPEQLGGGRIDGRSDLFALGLVLYEMLAGTPAFPAPTPIALVAAHAAGPSPLPTSVPEPLRSLCERLLELDPGRRPQTAEEVEAELGAVERETPAASGGPAASTGEASASPDPAASPPSLSRPAASPPAGSGIAAGLPAASAGLALLVPATVPEGAPAGAAGAANTASAATPLGSLTQAETMPLGVPRLAAEETAAPSVQAVPDAATAAARGGRRRRTALMAGGIAAVAGLALVLAASGLFGAGTTGHGQHVLAAPAASASPTPKPTPKPTAKPTPKPVVHAPAPPRGHKHKGHGNDD